MHKLCVLGVGLAAVMLSAGVYANVYTPGQHSVSDRGAGVYTIPLVVPPGAGGVEPKLALQYNSQGGNGIFGVGVSLDGLSSVTRCPQTPAQDNVHGAVRYNGDDRLCLDGRRLMVINGSYGADGAEYRFEHDDFSRIIGHGSMGSNTGWFEVTTRDGTIKQYGASSDSRVEAQGTSTIAVWALYRSINTSQNYLEWHYTKFSATGDWYPASVLYTGRLADAAGGAMPTFAEVRFLTYSGSDVNENRPDSIPQYRAGSKTQLTKRIRQIQTYADGALVRTYTLDYTTSPTSGRSMLAQLRECGASTCMQPTSLDWASTGSGSPQFKKLTEGRVGDWSGTTAPYFTMDAAGQGRSQAFGLNSYTEVMQAYAFSPSVQSVASFHIGNSYDYSEPNRFFSADVNGDGLDDLLLRQGDYTLVVCKAVAGGTSPCDGRTTTGDFRDSEGDPESDYMYSNLDPNRYFIMDVNDDGRADIVHRDSHGVVIAYLMQSDFSLVESFNHAFDNFSGMWDIDDDQYYPIIAMDLNGDKYPDIVRVRDLNRLQVLYGNGQGFVQGGDIPFPGGVLNTTQTPDKYQYFKGDVNGDGLADLVVYVADSGGTLTVLLNTGAGLVGGGSVTGVGYGVKIQVADINGDGRDDVAILHPSSDTQTSIWLSNGSSFYLALTQSLNVSGVQQITLADVTGDGSADVVGQTAWNDGNSLTAAWVLNSAWPDVVRQIKDGAGQRVVFDYGYLSYDDGLYVKDALPNYPLVSLQYPMRVVKTVTQTNVPLTACWTIGALDARCPGSSATNEPNPTTISTRYRYGGLRGEQASGRGLQGFRWIEATQEQTGVITTTTYEQDFPLTGMTKSVVTSAPGYGNGGILKQVTNTNGYVALPGKRYFSYLQETNEASWDLNGTAWPTKKITNTYDCNNAMPCYGDLTQSTMSASDGYGETKQITYRDNPTTNILGLPTHVVVTRTAP